MDISELSERLQQACLERDDPGLVELSKLLGFADGQKTTVNLLLLNDLTDDPGLLAAITADAAGSADPDQALNNLERLSWTIAKEELIPLLQQPTERRQLLTILGASAFLTSILCRKVEYFHDLFIAGRLKQAGSRDTMLEQLQRDIPLESDFNQLQQGLRQFKYHQVLRIGGRDLCGLANFQQTGAELADLASACLQRACDVCEQLLRNDYGAPLLDTEDDACPLEAEFTILGMGKLGGCELNFSSDIDLIYFYSSGRGQTSGITGQAGKGKQISLHQYYCKLGEQVGRALGQVTAEGFVFRVDLNLRPEGSRGELATPLRGAEIYYESWGQSWERTALLKGRPVAGSIPLGEQLLKTLEPFIYRRYLDYGMVEDMKGMKQRIDQSLSRKQEGEANLKLGRGGIREIEFFIQALQVVHAGKNPHLRVRNSLEALEQLQAEGLIPEQDHRTLREAYIFLRNSEHRIQMVQEGQTHNLPSRPEEIRALARRSGYDESEPFLVELKRHRDAVASLFHSLFYTSDEELSSGLRPEVGVMLDDQADPDLVKDLLEENGFQNPDGAFETLQVLRHGLPHNPMSPRSRRQLEKLAPQLLQAVIDSPEPDMALGNLESFVVALRARATFFSLLAQNPEVIERLVNLFATSKFLSRIFIQSPQVLDSLVSRESVVGIKPLEAFRNDLQTQLGMVDNYEDQLDMLRRFRKEELLRIALNDMHGEVLQGQTARQLSELAEACLEAAVELARQELLPRFGLPFTDAGNPAEFAILGMGKLGGRELNYHSDLDLIFIYRGEGETREAEGTDPERFRKQSNREYFSRLAQRIISVLTLVTREGKVYEIDARLRPSGNQGPLVTSLDAFERYHQESAQLWERQALTKARAMSGPEDLCKEITELTGKIVYLQPLPENTATEIRRLRSRMETEIAREQEDRFNIKTGRGGMVDVEFLTQYLQLQHGAQHPELRNPNTLHTLQALAEAGLLEQTETQLLKSGYKFLRRLENRLRLVHDQSINELSADPTYLRKLARRLGYPERPKKPEAAFLEDYRSVTGNIRAIFEHYLGKN